MATGRAAVMKEYAKPFVIEELEVPAPEPGGVMLRMTEAGICGSDLHMWRGDPYSSSMVFGPEGRVGGHEGTGVIAMLGEGVTTDFAGIRVKEGDRVVHTAIAFCGRCRRCLRGEQNWCTGTPSRLDRRYRMFTGTYAEYLYLPPGRPFFRVPDELPSDALGFVNCAMGTVTEALLRADCREGDQVVIQGAGGLGLNAVAMAKDMGAHQVIVLDRLDNRLEMARAFGADHTVNIDQFGTPEARRERVRELTGGQGADIVLELVGRPELLLEGLSYLTTGGTFVEVGATTRGAIELEPTFIMRGKARIIGSWMYRPSLLPLILNMMVKNRGKVPYDRITSHRFPLEQVNEAFATAEWSGRQTEVIRAVLVP
ncbi:MAG TPA: zinc-binding dehydrogenase [Dehalococcoidia bacterium]|nr:zinc-binding dehydrogenase [Dehalococcoidia bacterium]